MGSHSLEVLGLGFPGFGQRPGARNLIQIPVELEVFKETLSKSSLGIVFAVDY